MYCQECGAEAQPNYRYCDQCGWELPQSDGGTQQAGSKYDVSNTREIGVYLCGLAILYLLNVIVRNAYQYLVYFDVDALSTVIMAGIFLLIAWSILSKYKWWDGLHPF